ncbi:hypothetical protein [Bacillus altitudinis]|uniref:hypothetical protein n=1 Tax=Bacillus altitudinis TaxID=293387 RepID=UPI0023CB0626|nr:hypothetical protein [Bacillus altitudinis]CAI7727826.1 hypothetical protein WT0BACILLUS_03834 [Bacillus altitudinis]
MKNCIICNGEINGDFAVCFDGSAICEKCLWKETEEIFGRINADENLYDAVKLSYEGYKCLEVPVNAEEMCKFIDRANEEMFRKNFDYNILEGAAHGGFLDILEKEIKEFKLGMSVREYLKLIISKATEKELEIQGWDTVILSHDEIIQVGLEHRLPECKAI